MKSYGEHGSYYRLINEAIEDGDRSRWSVVEDAYLMHHATMIRFYPHEELFMRLPAEVRALFAAPVPVRG